VKEKSGDLSKGGQGGGGGDPVFGRTEMRTRGERGKVGGRGEGEGGRGSTKGVGDNQGGTEKRTEPGREMVGSQL